MDINFDDEWSGDTLGPFGKYKDKKTPFKLHIFPNLLEQKIVSQLRDDINSSIKLKHKDNDLYKFKQSKDFLTEIPSKKLTATLHAFIDAMQEKVRKHLETKTGRSLSRKNFDITASRYDVGDYLLCHNDDIKDNLKGHGRTLAFIYYLNSRPWTEDDGGALLLFDSDSTGEPVTINNSIAPRPNTLIVFDTTSTSWHSVQEVYCKDDFRLSINGWFHADKPVKIDDDEQKIIEPCPYKFHKPINTDENLEKFFAEYFNQEYLMEKTCLLIRKRFKRKSEINLTNFLVKEKFDEINQALREAVKDEENLTHVGPYNKRNYRSIKLDKLPPVCVNLYKAFQSELFYMLLARLTGLDLQPPSIKSVCVNDDDDDDEDDDDDDEEDSDEEDGGFSSDSDEENEDEEDDEDQEADDEKKGDDDTIASLKAETETGIENKTVSSKRKAIQATTSKEGDIIQLKKSPSKRKRTSNPFGRMEYRHLDVGSYTLIHDHGYELSEKSALDVILHFNHDFTVNFADGGYISYIDGAPDEDLHDMDYELLTVEPKSNCLSLVYRCDEGTCRFLKYITKTHKSNYQDLYCVYYERPDDLPNTWKQENENKTT